MSGRLYSLIMRFKVMASSKAYRAVAVSMSFVNTASFILLFTSDCLHWWRLGLGMMRLVVAASLAGSSYLAWLNFVGFGVGWLLILWSARARGSVVSVKAYWLTLVRAVGYPLVYGVYFVWGASSARHSVPGLGALSVGAFMALCGCCLLAMLADRKPRPPRAPRRVVSHRLSQRAV